MLMIESIAELNQYIRLGQRFTKKNAAIQGQDELYLKLDRILADYCDYSGISKAEAAKSLQHYIERYAEDVRLFKNTRKYPFEIRNDNVPVSRTSYELFLISSYLFTRHRFSIACEMNSICETYETSSFIGVGPGIEIEILKDKLKKINAYDTCLSRFTIERYPHVNFFEREFDGGHPSDIIFAIELLEHLPDPYGLISRVYSALAPGGAFIATIASNVPQFDHIINFSKDDFEKKITDMGFIIQYSREIPHDYRIDKIEASNTFYILVKE